jgi:hypothetical protein
MHRFVTVAAVALALALGTASAHAAKGNKADKAAKGDKAAKRDPNSVVGTVQKVDGNNLTVLAGRGKKAAEVTVTTDASTKVKVNGQDGTLAQIKPGMHVVASPNNGTATTLHATDAREGAGKGKGKNKNGPTPDKSDAK